MVSQAVVTIARITRLSFVAVISIACAWVAHAANDAPTAWLPAIMLLLDEDDGERGPSRPPPAPPAPPIPTTPATLLLDDLPKPEDMTVVGGATLQPLIQLAPGSDGSNAAIQIVIGLDDGTGRLLSADLQGRVFLLDAANARQRQILDVSLRRAQFIQDRTNGLRSIALHPDFSRVGRPGYGKLYSVQFEQAADAGDTKVFEHPFKRPLTVHSVVSEWSVDPSTMAVAAGAGRDVLRIAHAGVVHGVEQIGFDPFALTGSPERGLLYMASGDGGNGNGFDGSAAQDPQSVHGKILRINPLEAGDDGYSVPASNPFAGSDDMPGELYAMGFRNPHRFSFHSDQATGEVHMVAVDIGQNAVEEINLVQPGMNYGWPLREGSFVYDTSDKFNPAPLPTDEVPGRFHYPLAQYRNVRPAAVTGVYVTPIGGANYIVFGDIVTGYLFGVPWATVKLDGSPQLPVISRFRPVLNSESKELLEILGKRRADLRLHRNGAVLLLSSKQNGTVYSMALTRTPVSRVVGKQRHPQRVGQRQDGTDGPEPTAYTLAMTSAAMSGRTMSPVPRSSPLIRLNSQN